jgi:hypothetical protein
MPPEISVARTTRLPDSDRITCNINACAEHIGCGTEHRTADGKSAKYSSSQRSGAFRTSLLLVPSFEDD